MKKIIFDIVGLRHHDFNEQLDELFDSVIGKQVMLMLEADNVGERNAVIAYIGPKCLGHVSRLMRRLALAALKETGEEEELYATVVEIDRVRKHLFVELEVSDTLEPDMTEEPNVLTGWTYDGPDLIRNSADMGRIIACMKQMTRLIKANPDVWTNEMEERMVDIERLMVHDLSGEMSAAIVKLIQMLTTLSVKNQAFREASLRLRYMDSEMATDHWREVMAQSVRDLAVSKEMNKLLERLGDDAPKEAAKLPKALISELHIDLGMLLSHIRNWCMPRKKVQQVRCLLALTLRLEQDGVALTPKTLLIPDDLVEWANGNEERTLFVEQFAKDRLLEKTAPDVMRKLTKMKAACRKKTPTEPSSAIEKRRLAIEHMEGLIRNAVGKTPRNRKKVLLPYVAAIRVGLVSNTMTVEDFNTYYGTDIKPATFSSYVPKEINRSDITGSESESTEQEYRDML